MVDAEKLALIKHLTTIGKDKSWDELAIQFKFKSGEHARTAWRGYREQVVKERNSNKQLPKDLYPLTPDECFKKESFSENLENETAELVCKSDTEIRSLEELIEKTNIDTNKWIISRYVQNYWGNNNDPHWQVKAWLNAKPRENKFKEEFLSFLKTYKSESKVRLKKDLGTDRWVCVIINKQDAHLNKYDIKGNNVLDSRFSKIERYIDETLEKAEKVGSIDRIIYILGSDQFNSEWTNTTTKGTPQTNILNYQESFSKICNHEVTVINMLRESCNQLEILYIPGNHDEYVGWHMVNWLKAHYREDTGVLIDDSPSYTKYIRYHNTAMMFNHGDGAKPAKLAGIFPMEFSEWSECKFYYLFTGDKHNEQINDFNGIKHYQLPALSKAQSLWDSKNGYSSTNAELTTFIIDRQEGLTDIFKKPV